MNKKLKVYKVKGHPENASVIMLHGYGANGRDLLGIAQSPSFSKLDLNWYFLEAPLEPFELKAFGGKAWFSLTLSSFNPNMNPKALETFYDMETSEFKSSIKAIQDSIWDLNLKGDVVIGGFSQGAMMAENVFMNDANLFKGLIAMSGAPLNYKKWKSVNIKKSVFVSHGEQDPVLPIRCGKDLNKNFKNLNLETETHWFNGGHEIPSSVLNEAGKYLNKILN